MSVIEKLKNLFQRIINIFNSKSNNCIEMKDQKCIEIDELLVENNEALDDKDAIEKFKAENIVFQKLNYLEQYIKIFSLNFPTEYNVYLEKINIQKSEYEIILNDYQAAVRDNLTTFSIDPESESERFVNVSNLEDEIKKFVDFVVNYKMYKDKFSKLCYRINIFYNAIINTSRDNVEITGQLKNAIASLDKNISEVSNLTFFSSDSRKKEEILNYIIYAEYLLFKASLRCKIIEDLSSYKSISKIYPLFIDSEYDKLIFNFFVDDLENMQVFITSNLSHDKMYEYILERCEVFQNQLKDYQTVFSDYDYFNEIIKFENTIDDISGMYGIKFELGVSSILNVDNNQMEFTSVNAVAIAIFNKINNVIARILLQTISGFKSEISYKELFFLCKIFEIDDEFVKAAQDTIFYSIQDKFSSLENKYSEYTKDCIQQKKKKLINYNGANKKKYVLFITITEDMIALVCNELERLCLDYKILGMDIYMNYSYFKGFKNLEENFGNFKEF